MKQTALILLALIAAAASAQAASVLYSDPDEGALIIRDARLAQALKDSDQICTQYSRRQLDADRLPKPSKKSQIREKAALQAEVNRLMGECLNSDKLAKNALARTLGSGAFDRLDKASAFEDMVYIRLQPAVSETYVELFPKASAKGSR